MPYETSARKATCQFSTSFLYGVSMDDTGIKGGIEEMSFVLDTVPVMKQNSDKYRAKSMKNEVEVEFMTQSSQIFNDATNSHRSFIILCKSDIMNIHIYSADIKISNVKYYVLYFELNFSK